MSRNFVNLDLASPFLSYL